jgi:hypothetical protein
MSASPSDEAVVDVHGVSRLSAEDTQSVPPRLVGHEVTSELVEVRVGRSDLDDESSRLLDRVAARSAADGARRQFDLIGAGRSGPQHRSGLRTVERVAEPRGADHDSVCQGSGHSRRCFQPTVPGEPSAATNTDDWCR